MLMDDHHRTRQHQFGEYRALVVIVAVNNTISARAQASRADRLKDE